MIRLKRAYEAPSPDDGTRVLVERLWPRGLTKERASIDVWLKDIAPSTELRTWFHHDPERWEEFRTRYERELGDNPEAVQRLEDLAEEGTVTLIYAARDTEHNGAFVLKGMLGRR